MDLVLPLKYCSDMEKSINCQGDGNFYSNESSYSDIQFPFKMGKISNESMEHFFIYFT